MLDDWKELAEYLGDNFDPRSCRNTTHLVADEFTRFGSDQDFYKCSDAYLYDLTAFAASGTKKPYHAYIRLLLQKGAKVLDYGCGIGSDGLALIQDGYTVSFADFKNPSTDYLKWRLRRRGLQANVYDVECLPRGLHFDLAYAFDVLEHVKDPMSVLERLETLADYMVVNAIHGDDPRDFPMHYDHDWNAIQGWIGEKNTLLLQTDIYRRSDNQSCIKLRPE